MQENLRAETLPDLQQSDADAITGLDRQELLRSMFLYFTLSYYIILCYVSFMTLYDIL